MKILQSNLKMLLSETLSIIKPKPALPILANVLITVSENIMTMSASSGELFYTRRMACESDNMTFCVNAKTLYQIINNISADTEITIQPQKDAISILFGKSKYKLALMDAALFPVAPQPFGEPIVIDVKQMQTLFTHVGFAIANEEDYRMDIKSVYLATSKSAILAVTTDGHKFALASHGHFHDSDTEFLITSSAISLLMRLPESQTQASQDNNHIFFTSDSFTVSIRKLNKRFADYKKIIPASPKYSAVFKCDDMRAALARIAQIVDRSIVGIEIDCSESGIVLRSAAKDIGDGEEFVSGECSASFKVNFNVNYFKEALQVIDAEQAQIIAFEDSSVLYGVSPVGDYAIDYSCYIGALRFIAPATPTK